MQYWGGFEEGAAQQGALHGPYKDEHLNAPTNEHRAPRIAKPFPTTLGP